MRRTLTAHELPGEPGVVPYITAWTSERAPAPDVIAGPAGVGYRDESPYDRDTDGVLWTRVPHSPGHGRPEFGRVHVLRQRRAIRRLLCQVCGQPADKNRDGTLWLLGEDATERDNWPSDLITSHPPLCAPCAQRATRLCPHLRRQCVALRVRTHSPAGVRGVLYRPAWPFPVAWTDATVAYDDVRLRWTRAGQLVVRLEAYSVVDV